MSWVIDSKQILTLVFECLDYILDRTCVKSLTIGRYVQRGSTAIIRQDRFWALQAGLGIRLSTRHSPDGDLALFQREKLEAGTALL